MLGEGFEVDDVLAVVGEAGPQGGAVAALALAPEAFVPVGETLELPVLGGALDTGGAFPPVSG